MIRGAPDPSITGDRPPWSPIETAIGTLATLGPLLAINIFNAVATNATGGLTTLSHQEDLSLGITNFIVSSLLEAVFLIAPIYFARRHRAGDAARGQPPVRVTEALGLRGFDTRLALGLLVLSATLVLIISYLYDAITTKFGISSPTNLDQLIAEYHQAPITITLTLVAAVLVAPICEELFFRSFLLQGLRATMPTWAAIVVSSLIFAAVHLQGGSFLLLFVLALCLGVLRVATRSVWPGVILHTLNNALAFIVLIQAVR